MARMTLDELLRQNIAGAQVFDPLSQRVGIKDWQYSGGGMDEAGNALSLGIPDASKLAALQGYTFDWQDTGPENTGTLIAYDPQGNPVGQFNQTDQSLGSALGEWAALAAAGFGGAGLLGLGPLGGVLGGAGGLGSSVAGAGGEAAANLAAYGASLTPAEIAAMGAVDLGAAGTAGGGLGTITGGAGLTAGGISGAGITAPTLAQGAGLGAGLGTVGAAGGAAGAGGAGGGFLASLGGMKGLLPVAGQLLGTGLQMNAASKARDDMQAATNASNNLQKYMYDTTRADNMPALQARNNALTQVQSLLRDPSSITKAPDYQFGLDQGTKALQNSATGRGMTYSGQQAKALQRYGNDYAGSKLTESANRLLALASGGQAGASQIGGAGANYAGNVGNALMSQGDANAALRMGQGSTIADTINGLTAYGTRKGWWGG